MKLNERLESDVQMFIDSLIRCISRDGFYKDVNSLRAASIQVNQLSNAINQLIGAIDQSKDVNK